MDFGMDFDDFLDDIDVDIRKEVAKELEDKSTEEIDAIDVRAVVDERARTPEETYALEVIKQEREFRQLRRKLHRYVDSDGIAYYGKATWGKLGYTASLAILALTFYMYYQSWQSAHSMAFAIVFMLATIPAITAYVMDNMLIKREHQTREEERFKALNMLRKELGLPQMVGKEAFLVSKSKVTGVSLIVWSLITFGVLTFKLGVLTYAEAGGLLGGFLVILLAYSIIWGVRRKRSIRDCEVDDAQVATCVSKVRKLGFDNRIHTTGTFRIKFDEADNPVELSSPYVGRGVESGDTCKWYKIQGVFERRYRYYFGVRPPTADLVTAKLLKLLIIGGIITVAAVYIINYTDLLTKLMEVVRNGIQ